MKTCLSEDIEKLISNKFIELTEQFVTSSDSITEGFKKLEQQNKELQAKID
jgi:hypothetical protein